MTKERPILTNDGNLVEIGDITIDPKTNKPIAFGIFEVLGDNKIIELINDGNNSFLSGKSGHSQVGIDSVIDQSTTLEINKNDLIKIPLIIRSLAEGNNDSWLQTIKDQIDNGQNIPMGRIFCADKSIALSENEIEEAVDKKWIWIPEGSEISSEGIISIPFEDIEYLLSRYLDDNLRTDILKYGRPAIQKIQSARKQSLDDLPLKEGNFFLGAIKLSIGPFVAVIDRELNDPEIIHLASRVLDSARTTGKDEVRQIEIFNSAETPKNLKELRVKIRLYPSPDIKAENIFHIIRNQTEQSVQNILNRGLTLEEVTNLSDPKVFQSLFEGISTSPQENNSSFARLITHKRLVNIPWERSELLQEELLKRWTRRSPNGHGIKPTQVQNFMHDLTYMGGPQYPRRMMISHVFPSGACMKSLQAEGVRVFLAKGLNLNLDVFEPNKEISPKKNNVYFDERTYQNFIDIYKNGGHIYMVFNIDNEEVLYEFHKGFWMRSKTKEKMSDIGFTLAMYGSHVNGLDKLLKNDISKFFEKIKTLFETKFNTKVMIESGKGDGIMLISDNAAREKGLLSCGIGIDAEKIKPASRMTDNNNDRGYNKQESNFSPDIMLDFQTSARNKRQHLLNIISNVEIFNVGGSGTLEELATVLTDTKIGEKIPTPFILVDQKGLGRNKKHLFQKVYEQLEDMATKQKITVDKKNYAFRLLQKWVPKCFHLVRSYDDAYDVLEKFVNDPISYWKKRNIPMQHILQSFENAEKHSKETEIPIPKILLDAKKTLSN